MDFGAEALRRRALDGLCATMGEEHPNTLAVANHWANSTWLRMQAPPAATATCCVACCACYRRPHGPDRFGRTRLVGRAELRQSA